VASRSTDPETATRSIQAKQPYTSRMKRKNAHLNLNERDLTNRRTEEHTNSRSSLPEKNRARIWALPPSPNTTNDQTKRRKWIYESNVYTDLYIHTTDPRKNNSAATNRQIESGEAERLPCTGGRGNSPFGSGGWGDGGGARRLRSFRSSAREDWRGGAGEGEYKRDG
jgi:hypothetical protein